MAIQTFNIVYLINWITILHDCYDLSDKSVREEWRCCCSGTSNYSSLDTLPRLSFNVVGTLNNFLSDKLTKFRGICDFDLTYS